MKKYLFKNDQKCSVGVHRSDLVLCCVNATFILRLIVGMMNLSKTGVYIKSKVDQELESFLERSFLIEWRTTFALNYLHQNPETMSNYRDKTMFAALKKSS